MADSLSDFDVELARLLAGLDDATLREAWHAATERTEALVAIRRSVDAFDARARELGIDVLARTDRGQGTRLALRFMTESSSRGDAIRWARGLSRSARMCLPR
jgi:hypothetical protein